MTKKDTANLKAELLGVKDKAVATYNDIISKEVDIINSINKGDFDKLFETFSNKAMWDHFAHEAQSAHGSWFFSGLKSDMVVSNIESTIMTGLAIAPKGVATNSIQDDMKSIIEKYFELDASGNIRPEDMEANKDAFSVFQALGGLAGQGSKVDHTITLDHKMPDGTTTHLEAKFDSEKFGEWIKYNLVEEHYLDHTFDA